MNTPFLSVSQWKLLLVSLVLTIFALFVWANGNWERSFKPELNGKLGATFSPPDRDYHLTIVKLSDDSALGKAGARVGDKALYDRDGDRIRPLGTDELIGLTIITEQGARHLQVRPQVPAVKADSGKINAAGFGAVWILNYVGLFFALLIGLRRPEDGAMRAFALSILSASCAGIASSLPGGIIQNFLSRSIEPINGFFFYAAFVYFTLIFPQQRQHLARPWVRRAFGVYLGIFLAIEAGLLAYNFRVLPWALRESLPLIQMAQVMGMLSVVIAVTALWFSWRSSNGTERQRLAWIGVCMGTFYGVDLFSNLMFVSGIPIGGDAYTIGRFSLLLLAYGGFAYAVLRHRLFDLGFAINRALVYTVLSALLVLLFSVTEWGVDKLLHFDGREKNLLLDAFVALCIMLSIKRIEHWVSHKVDHTFFHHWHEAAEKLRHFLALAPHISDAVALRTKFIAAIEAFSATEGVAIYAMAARKEAALGFGLLDATLPDAPPHIDANHNAILELRHARAVVELADRQHALPGGLAFPMLVRGELIGLVLIALKRNGNNYRPDEITLLTSSVRQLGMDLETLRIEQLERSEAQLQQTAAALEREAAALRQIVNGRLLEPMTR